MQKSGQQGNSQDTIEHLSNRAPGVDRGDGAGEAGWPDPAGPCRLGSDCQLNPEGQQRASEKF